MKAIGTVNNVDSKTAVVEITRSSACSSCHNCESKNNCHIELLFGNQTETVCVNADNSINAKVGDKVEIESSTKTTLFMSFFVYVIPVIVTAVAYLLFDGILADSVASVLALVVLIVSFVITALLANRAAKKRIKPVIMKILEENE